MHTNYAAYQQQIICPLLWLNGAFRSELDALRMSLEEAMRTMKVSSKLKAWLQVKIFCGRFIIPCK